MNIEEKDILEFNDDYKPANIDPKEDGFYMTICCGYNGIYTFLNEWRNGIWVVGLMNGGKIIAYSIKPIPRDEVDMWLRKTTGYSL